MYLLSAPKVKPGKKFVVSSLWFVVKKVFSNFQNYDKKRLRYTVAAGIDVILILLILVNVQKPAVRLVTSVTSSFNQLRPLTDSKSGYEVFGFAPYWTFNKLSNVDFKILTTFAYFGVDVDGEGNLDKSGVGFETFKSQKATEIFKKAHQNGTKVVLTLTQMDNDQILALMDNPEAQTKVIEDSVSEVKDRGIDGINVDFEFSKDPGQDYRNKFSNFISNLTTRMHQEVHHSKVSVSVYASAVKNLKIYDIADLGKLDISIFMMAYDFGYRGSDEVIPTSPLYGHKAGKYWYDVSTAVEDFLSLMPAGKLILGNPWYGYNYLIYGEPKVKAEVRPSWSWRGGPRAQTYQIAQDDINPSMEGIIDYKEGWDELGKVGWKAYFVESVDTWKMIFIEDPKSLGIKYDFAKSKNLGGVGIWALGFDDGKRELWDLLVDKFGQKLSADSTIVQRSIN